MNIVLGVFFVNFACLDLLFFLNLNMHLPAGKISQTVNSRSFDDPQNRLS